MLAYQPNLACDPCSYDIYSSMMRYPSPFHSQKVVTQVWHQSTCELLTVLSCSQVFAMACLGVEHHQSFSSINFHCMSTWERTVSSLFRNTCAILLESTGKHVFLLRLSALASGTWTWGMISVGNYPTSFLFGALSLTKLPWHNLSRSSRRGGPTI